MQRRKGTHDADPHFCVCASKPGLRTRLQASGFGDGLILHVRVNVNAPVSCEARLQARDGPAVTTTVTEYMESPTSYQ